MINDVMFKELKTFTDERGYFREVIRVTDDFFGAGFGQLSHSLVYAGTIKAWHIHQKQTDWWYVPAGLLKVALHDTRAQSSTFRQTMEFLLGEHQPARAVRIPPGVAHGYRCLSGPASVIYVTSRVYDPADEGRIPHADPAIGYDWLKEPDIT